jgi:hypothetical protein
VGDGPVSGGWVRGWGMGQGVGDGPGDERPPHTLEQCSGLNNKGLQSQGRVPKPTQAYSVPIIESTVQDQVVCRPHSF